MMTRTIKLLKRSMAALLSILFLALIIFCVFQWDLIKRLNSTGKAYPTDAIAECQKESHSFVLSRDYQDPIKEAKEILVHHIRDAFFVPGMAVCIAKENEVIWYEGFGCSDLNDPKAVNQETLFRIGSISKALTAIGAMNLIEKRIVNLDQKINTLIDELPGQLQGIKIRHLLSHQSGVGHYKGLEMLSNSNYNSIEGGLEVFINRKLKFEPGMGFAYSTYGYSLLGHCLEKATGSEYPTYMENEVFIPLQMQRTKMELKQDNVSCFRSFPEKMKIKNAVEVDVSNKWAGGGMLSTPEDLVHAVLFLDKILSDETITHMWTTQTMHDGTTSPQDYALGWRVTKLSEQNRTLIHHGGSSIGGRAFLLHIPEEKLTIAICTNSHTGIINPQNYGLQEVYNVTKPFLTKNGK